MCRTSLVLSVIVVLSGACTVSAGIDPVEDGKITSIVWPRKVEIIGPTTVKAGRMAAFQLNGLPIEFLKSFDWVVFNKPDDAVILDLADRRTGQPVLVFQSETPGHYAIIADINVLPLEDCQLIVHEFMVGEGPVPPPPTHYDLTTATVGDGSVSPDRGTYEAGTRVALVATPGPEHVFDRWSGDAWGDNPAVEVVMDGDKHAVAHFEEDEPPPPPDVSAWIIFYYESTEVDDRGNEWMANVISSQKIRRLESGKLNMDWVDKDQRDEDKQPSPDLKPYLDEIDRRKLPLPQAAFVNEKGEMYHVQSWPKSVDATVKLVKEHMP